MKKMMIAAAALAIAGVNLQTAKAGDKEWATAGKILTGVVAGAVIANALDGTPAHASVTYTYAPAAYCPPPPPRAVVYAPAPVVCPPPVVYAPPPVVVYRPPVCAPRPVMVVKHGHRGGPRHGWGRSHCR